MDLYAELEADFIAVRLCIFSFMLHACRLLLHVDSPKSVETSALKPTLSLLQTQVAPTALAQSTTTEYARCVHLLGQRTVRLVIAAIWLSTSAMAILEPCLPVWLMENLHPKRWQVGTVFVPDSVGYFLGTNFFAARALRLGQLRVAVVCLLAVGVSCFAVRSGFSRWFHYNLYTYLYIYT